MSVDDTRDTKECGHCLRAMANMKSNGFPFTIVK